MAELLDLKPDGTARLTLNGKTVTLRRPTVGQVRAVHDAAIDAADRAADIAEDHAERVRDAAAEHGVDLDADPVADAAGRVLGYWRTVAAQMDDKTADERTVLLRGWVDEVVADAEPDTGDDPASDRAWRRALRDLNRQQQREQQAGYFDIGRLVVKELAAGSFTLPDDDDDLDPMLGQSWAYTDLIRHWTSRPNR